MTTDLSTLNLDSASERIAVQIAQPSEPTFGTSQLEQYKTGTMQSVALLAPRATDGDTAERALSGYISQLKSSEASSGTQANDAIWSDFDNRVSSSGGTQSIRQISALKQLSANPESVQTLLVGSGFRQSVAPQAPASIQSTKFVTDQSNVASLLLPSSQPSAVASDKPLVRIAPVSVAGWFCRLDGTSGFSNATEGAEGEPPVDGDDDSDNEIVIPQIDFPELELTRYSGSLDDYSPGSQATGQTSDTLGSFTASTTPQSDLSVPGVNFVHTVNRIWIDSDHWSITETLIMGFNVSTTTTPTINPSSGSEDASNGTTGNLSTGDHPVTETASASITVNRSGFVILTFHAEKGMSTPVAAGVLWSVNLSFRDRASISLSAFGGRHVAPIVSATSSNGTGTNMSGSGSSGTEDASVGTGTGATSNPLPANFTSTSSWTFNIGFQVWVNGTVSVSSTPSLVASSTAINGTELERDIAFTADVGAGVELLVGSAWSASSRSGDLNTPDPNATFPQPPAGVIDPGFGTGDDGSSSNGQIDVPENGVLTIDPDATAIEWQSNSQNWQPMPLPRGIGHQFGSSGNASATVTRTDSFGMSFAAKVRGSDHLTSLSGSMRAGFSDAYGDSSQDNQILVFSSGGGDSNSRWRGNLVSYNNVNAQSSANIGSQIEEGIGLGLQQDVLSSPLRDTETFNNGGSNTEFTFELLSIRAVNKVQQPDGGYTYRTDLLIDSKGTSGTASGTIKAESKLNATTTGETKLKWGNSGFGFKSYSTDYQSLELVAPDSFIVSGTERTHNSDRDSWTFTYSSKGDTTDTLNASGTVDPSGTADAKSTESFSYHSMESHLRTIREANDGLWILDYFRDANYSKSFVNVGNYDALENPATTSDETPSGDDRVRVIGHSNLDIWRSPQHYWNYENLETGYRETFNGRGLPFFFTPENFDPRNDFERLFGTGTTGTCSPSSSSSGGATDLTGEGEDPLDCGKPLPAFALRFFALDEHQRKAPIAQLQENMKNAANAVETSASLLPGGGLATTSFHLGTGQNLDQSEVSPMQASLETILFFLPVVVNRMCDAGKAVLAKARATGDCASATFTLMDHFGGFARQLSVRGRNLDHTYLTTRSGMILDVLFKQNFVATGILSETLLRKHKLWEAVESGVFTAKQYELLKELLEKYGKW